MQSDQLTASLGTPAAEVTIDIALVHGLLAEQHSDLADLTLVAVDAGWDNALFRLGERLAVRLPRRAASAPLILHEQRWLPALAAQLCLPAPIPLRAGLPGLGYPWHWSVVPWLEGEPADCCPPDDTQAVVFANYLRALHQPAPADAPANPFRGVALSQRADAVEQRLQRLAEKTDLITLRLWEIWRRALRAPIDVQATWLHGDLHSRNVLVADGKLTGVIDWGDLTSGDCATDLAAIWMLFGAAESRWASLQTYGPLSNSTYERALGWAILFGAMLLDSGLVDNPRNALIGEQTLRRVLE